MYRNIADEKTVLLLELIDVIEPNNTKKQLEAN
jgi:hypothetical protein